MLGLLDGLVIVVYIIGTLAVASWAGRSNVADSTDEFFLGGRSQSPFVVAISLISGLTSGISFMGTPGYSYAHGLGIAFQTVGAVLVIPLVVWLIIPFYSRCDSASAYAYLEQRFSKSIRTIAATLFLCRVVLYMAVVLLAPALAVNAVTGIHELFVVILCGSCATVFTMQKGMHAVVWVDFMQSIVIVVIVLGTLIVCSVNIPGGIFQKSVLNRWSDNFWVVQNSMDDNVYFILVGGFIMSMCQCGTDQIAVQRYLAADVNSTQKSALLGCFMNTLCGFALVLTGASLYEYYQLTATEPICNHAGAQHDSCVQSADQILPFFAVYSMPAGVAGIMLAAVLGCTMSVFSSGLSAATTCATVDITQNMLGYFQTDDHWASAADRRVDAEEQQKALVSLSRKLTGAIGVAIISIAVASTCLGKGLIQLAVTALGLTAGPVLGIFLLGMMTVRVDSRSALTAFAAGLWLMVYFALGQAFCSKEQPCGGVLFFANLNEFMLSPILTFVTLVVGLAASLICPDQHAKHTLDLEGLTIWTIPEKETDGISNGVIYSKIRTDQVVPYEDDVDPF